MKKCPFCGAPAKKVGDIRDPSYKYIKPEVSLQEALRMAISKAYTEAGEWHLLTEEKIAAHLAPQIERAIQAGIAIGRKLDATKDDALRAAFRAMEE
jgi:hypothetical protein